MKAQELKLTDVIYSIEKLTDGCKEHNILALSVYSSDKIEVELPQRTLLIKKNYGFHEENGITYYFTRKDYLGPHLGILQKQERVMNLKHIALNKQIEDIVNEINKA